MTALVFTTSDAWVDRLIRVVSWSPWSHVGLLTDHQTFLESAPSLGVKESPWIVRVRQFTRVVAVPLPTTFNARVVTQRCRSQIGKPYDYWGVLGASHAPDKWYCSNLMTWGLGLHPLGYGIVVSPGDLYALMTGEESVLRRTFQDLNTTWGKG